MRKLFLITASAALLTASFAMPSYAEGSNQFFGTLTGATLGGIIGNQFGHGSGRVAATAAGVVAGGWIGNDIGYSMDNSGHTVAVSSGFSAPNADMFSNNTNNTYRPNYVAPNDAPPPQSAYDQSYVRYCRPYSQQVQVNGHIQENYGTACLQPDGTWRAVQ